MSDRPYWGQRESDIPQDTSKLYGNELKAVLYAQVAERLAGAAPAVRIYKDYTDDFMHYIGRVPDGVSGVKVETFDPALSEDLNIWFVLWYRVNDQRYGHKAAIPRYYTHDIDRFNLTLNYTLQNLAVLFHRETDRLLAATEPGDEQ